MNEDKKAKSFDDTMHLYGRVWASISIFLMLMVPVAVALYFGAVPEWGPLLKAVASLSVIYVPVCIVEVLTYAPMLGTGASYLAFITGNLSNLKIPCAMNAREIVGTEFGTRENEIVSTLSVAVSALVTTLVLAVGVLLLVPLGPLLFSPVLAPAFGVVLPALFGALGFTYISKNLKIAVPPLLLLSSLCFFFPFLGGQVALLILVGAIFTIGVARLLYVKGKL